MFYPVCKSAIKPVSHILDLPVPKFSTEKDIRCLFSEHASEIEEDLIESDPFFKNESSLLLIN